MTEIHRIRMFKDVAFCYMSLFSSNRLKSLARKPFRPGFGIRVSKFTMFRPCYKSKNQNILLRLFRYS